MKKIIALVLCITLSLSLIACGTETDEPIQLGTVNPFDKESIGVAGTVEVDATKDAYNRLTGEYNLARDREKSRPVAVAVNNIVYAIPQYGISYADFITEMETEGGITRLMCVFGDTRELDMVGSVRSLRDQFMQILLPIDAMIVHIGKSIYAERFMAQYNYETIDGDVVREAVSMNNDVFAQRGESEHSWFTSGLEIETGMDLAGVTLETSTSDVKLFNFIEVDAEKIVPAAGTANEVTFDYSSGYDGDFRYDAETGKYLKWQHGKPQVDAGNDDKQLEFENVFLLTAEISPREDADLIEVDYVQGGVGYYFTQGAYQEINWAKSDASAPFVFTDSSTGEEVSVNTGKSFLAVIRTDYADSIEIA